MALDKLTKVQSVGISSFIQVVGVVTATGGFVGDLTGCNWKYNWDYIKCIWCNW